MLTDVQIYLMILVSLIAAVPKSKWRGTAIFMLLFALFNLAVDPLIDHQSKLSPFILGTMDFLGGSLLLVWGSKSTKDVAALTIIIAWLFFFALILELFMVQDLNTDSYLVYTNYEWKILVLNLTQMTLIVGGMFYGRIPRTNANDRRVGRRAPVEAR